MRTNKSFQSTTLSITTVGLLALGGCPSDDTSPPGATDGDTSTTMADSSSTTGDSSSADSSSSDSSSTTGDTTEGSSSTGTGEADLLEQVLEALGGRDEVEALATAELQVTGTRYMANQGLMPGDPALAVSDFDTTVSFDFSTLSVRNDIVRGILFFPVPGPLLITEWAVPDAGGGYVQGVEGLFPGSPAESTMLSDRYASTLEQAVLLNPHAILQDAAAGETIATEVGTGEWDGQTFDLLELSGGLDDLPIVLWIDQETDLLRRAVSLENSHLHRDVEIEARYDGWQNTDADVLFPSGVQLYVNGELIHDETRNQVDANVRFDADLFTLPDGANPVLDEAEFERGLANHHHNQIFASIGIPTDGLQPFIMASELEPGVHHITGGSHHSLIVEQEGGVVVFEAPLNAQRCESILQFIDDELGGAPVTHIVLTHHHSDHSACARTFVATGAELVIHESAQAFFEDVLAAPSTIEPDRLEIDPVMNPVIQTVPEGGSLLLDDPTNPVEVFDMASSHSFDMVLPYVDPAGPNNGVLFTSDIYAPGSISLPPGPQETLDAINLIGIAGELSTIAGGHGGVGDLDTLIVEAGS
ncbi:MAG: MBL fold metallo-hydrolase [Nannocystaceae bacterium]